MRTPAIAMLVVLSVFLALQAAGVMLPATRDANRQFLIAEAQGTYDPAALVVVTSGSASDPSSSTMTAAQALELQLDFLAAEGIALAAEKAAATASDPAWPLQGRLTFHETGWVDNRGEGDASCPSIILVDPAEEPAQAAIADVYRDVMGEDPPADAGRFRTDVSTYWLDNFGNPAWSWVKHETAAALAGLEDPVSYPYGAEIGEGWVIEAGFVVLDGNEDGRFFCVEPTGSRGLVRLDAVVVPQADRVG